MKLLLSLLEKLLQRKYSTDNYQVVVETGANPIKKDTEKCVN